MNIINDFTSYPWTIILKHKSDAFPALQAWEKAREIETGLVVGTYRTDNGELKSTEMRAWLQSRGTTQQFTAPYTSAHIGRVERLHRTLMNKARTMRLYAGLPPTLWDEFYLTASHLHAKTISKKLHRGTPWELWFRCKPDLSYLHEPGCCAFVLIVNKHNLKIYEHSIECILIGYNADSKTYRCYDPKTKIIHSSYHVQFLESQDGYIRTSSTSGTSQIPSAALPLPTSVTPSPFPPDAAGHDDLEDTPVGRPVNAIVPAVVPGVDTTMDDAVDDIIHEGGGDIPPANPVVILPAPPAHNLTAPVHVSSRLAS
jgi:hypothetical protein